MVLLAGLSLGLGGWFIFLWMPAAIHWGGIIATLYPLSVGYAVLRYQLFDIRVVVRKGLVYSLLNNVVKHAEAHQVEVALIRDKAHVTLRVADDGQGFDPQASRPGMHVGLWS